MAVSFGTNENRNTFVLFSAYALLVDIVLYFCLSKAQGKYIATINVFYLMFVLFQFGMPITYVLSSTHFNYYFELFEEGVHIKAVYYTQLAIQVTSISLTVGLKQKKKDVIGKGTSKWERLILNNKSLVAKAGLTLFVFTSLFVVPINLKAAFTAIAARGIGINIGNAYRGAKTETGLLRFMQEFFFPSAILFLCFSSKRTGKRIVTIIYVVVSFVLVIVADRNAGITALLVMVIYNYQKSENKQALKKYMKIFAAIAILGIISVYVAKNRSTGVGVAGVLRDNVFLLALDEMGFNFTSICFVMTYIPKYDAFRYGLSYLAAIALLIPKSFDFLNWYPLVQSVLGETWLWNMNNNIGRTNLSFGVGFSVIAESYYN